MCECPGDQCHCEVLTAYARECERAGFMVHNWRDSTGCKNVSSFKYSGLGNHVTHDGLGNDEVHWHNNEVIQANTGQRAAPKFISTNLGEFLPACSPESAVQCDQGYARKEDTAKMPDAAKQKLKPRKRKRLERRQKERERQKRREERRMKRRERRRRRKQREKERQEQRKRNRRKERKEKKKKKKKNERLLRPKSDGGQRPPVALYGSSS
jgi:hypothetical protein